MAVSVAYGAALAAAGCLMAGAIRAAHRERVLDALGPVIPDAGARARPPGALARRAARRGWPASALAYGGASVASSVTLGALGWHLAGPVGCLAGTVGGPLAIEAMLSRRLARARERAEEELREAVLALAAGARAGLSLRRALAEAAGEAEPPLRATLEEALGRLEVGEPLEEMLDDLAKRIGSPDAQLLVTVLSVHRRTGGDLPSLLDEVAGIIGQRTEGRRQLRALTAQGRASGTVLAVLPIAFVTLLSWTGGDGLGAFYRTTQGSALLLAGLVCEILGFAWIRRIVRERP